MIRNINVDLIFIDIEMPQVSGIDFINSLEQKPYIIFTTAYSEYALEAFNLNAIDYLVKPIPFARFFKAVNKVNELHKLRSKPVIPVEIPVSKPVEKEEEIKYLLVKAEYSTVRVNIDEVKYIEGLKDYIKIYASTDKPILTLNSLKRMEEKLPESKFLRIHKSYIISLEQIEAITKNQVIIGEKRIPIGESYRQNFLETIKRNSL